MCRVQDSNPDEHVVPQEATINSENSCRLFTFTLVIIYKKSGCTLEFQKVDLINLTSID